MIQVDESRYVLSVGGYLQRFKKDSATTWSCRCPLCGDSQKNKAKARGHFYPARAGGYVFHCYNCQAHMFLSKFLHRVAPAIYDEMMLEKFAGGSYGKRKQQPPAPTAAITEIASVGISTIKPFVSSLASLPDTHTAREFMIRRRIPKQHWEIFQYAPNFAHIANLTEKYRDRIRPEARLVIPTFARNKQLLSVAGRALGKESLRYISIAFDEQDARPLIFGLDRLNQNERIYVVEGQIDSLFLPNAVAVNTSNLAKGFDLIGPKDRVTLIPDREPRNKEIVKQTGKLCRAGYTVCLLPDGLPGKDINDMVLGGLNPPEILELVHRYSFAGIRAELEFENWRKA
jgi:hypothetical protein